MKRIALITKGFTGSTFPLAKQLIEKGYAVDIYLFYYLSFEDLEAFNCTYKSKVYGVEAILPKIWFEMYSYFGNSNSIRLFSLRMPRPFSKIPIIKNIVSFYSKWFSLKSSAFINKQNYEVINFIGGYYSHEYIPILKKLKSKIVFSLHEVCDHYNPNFSSPASLLKYLFKNKIDIIIYSDKSYRDIINYHNVDIAKLHRLNFGLFETFKTIPFGKSLSLPEKYFLFFGSILPYKGMSILCEALKHIEYLLPDYKVVIAGKGTDPCLEELSNNKHVIVINKRLSNAELCEVIYNSMFVVCPYLSMSQSGIPQTVYAFGKPIIASNLDGFKEVIESGINGLLFNVGKSEELAACIKQLLSNETYLRNISDQVNKFEDSYPEYSWSHITDTFIKTFICR